MATTKVTTGGITDATIATADIANDAVTADKIADDAIQSEHYGNTSIDTEHLANNAVTGPKIAGNTVGTSNLQDDAITLAKMADDSVSASQIINNAVTVNALATDAVTTPKIGDQQVTLAKLEHGTSSNDGKFLRANNGADPTFETVTGTTINNQGNNKVLTSTATNNTIQAEDALQWNGTDLDVVSGNSQMRLTCSNNTPKINFDANNVTDAGRIQLSESSGGGVFIFKSKNTGGSFTERLRIQTEGGISFNGDSATANALDDYEEGTWSPGINSGTANFGNAYYTKVGRFVNATVFVSGMSPRTATFGIQITGLPFQANGIFVAPIGLHRVIGDQGNGYFGYVSDNTSTIDLLQFPWSQQGWKSLNHNQIQHATAAYIIITLSYTVD